MLGPHTRTAAPTARGWRTPTACPERGQSGEGERLTSDAPHNGGRRPPQVTPFRHPHSVQRRPARAHARCGAGAGSPCPHRPHPGHTGRGTPATRPRGRAAGGGTAPDTRCPSQQSQATPPRDSGHNPRGTQPPQGMHASQGDSAGPPHPHTRARSTWAADPNSRPGGRAVGGGGAPDLRRASQRRTATPPGDALPPLPQRATPARKGARCGAVPGSPRPHRPYPAARPRGRAPRGRDSA